MLILTSMSEMMFCSIRIGSPTHCGLMDKAVFVWKGPQQITETYRHVHLTHTFHCNLMALNFALVTIILNVTDLFVCIHMCDTSSIMNRLLALMWQHCLQVHCVCVCFYICVHLMSAWWPLLTPRRRKWHTRLNHVSQMTPRCQMIHTDLLSQWADKVCVGSLSLMLLRESKKQAEIEYISISAGF